MWGRLIHVTTRFFKISEKFFRIPNNHFLILPSIPKSFHVEQTELNYNKIPYYSVYLNAFPKEFRRNKSNYTMRINHSKSLQRCRNQRYQGDRFRLRLNKWQPDSPSLQLRWLKPTRSVVAFDLYKNRLKSLFKQSIYYQ